MTVRSDSYTNEAGTGAAPFPFGISIFGVDGGKYVQVEQSSAAAITDATEVDVTGTTLSVGAGTYRVTFGGMFHVQSSGVAAGASPIGYLRVTDNSNTDLAAFPGTGAGEQLSFGRGADGATDQYVGNFIRIATVTLGSTTDVKLRAFINDTVGGTGTSVRQVNEAYMIWEKLS